MFEKLNGVQKYYLREMFLRAWAENTVEAENEENRLKARLFRRNAGELNSLIKYLEAKEPQGVKVSGIGLTSILFEADGYHYSIHRNEALDATSNAYSTLKGEWWFVARDDLRTKPHRSAYILRTRSGEWFVKNSHSGKAEFLAPAGDDVRLCLDKIARNFIED